MPRKEPQKIIVRDAYQKYTYMLTEPTGKNFDPEFKPHLTPHQMLKLGVFGGKYFGDKPKEFPKSWWVGAKLPKDRKKDPDLNYFEVNASQPLSVWEKKGWIHPQDPRSARVQW